MDERLLALLCCPADQGALHPAAGGGLCCEACGAQYPGDGGVVSFLSPEELTEQELREQASRDAESVWYDSMFEGYTNAVEVPTAVARIGRPAGPILDHGAGTGRITEALVGFGQPVVAVDYSAVSLRRLLERCGHGPVPVLALQADLRQLPVRAGVITAATSVEVYEHFRGPAQRRLVLDQLARVLVPGGVLSLTAFNYNLLYRAWTLAGNVGAREGEHMLGGDFYYRRFTGRELRAELEQVFDVTELTGIRNIPARTLAGAVRRVANEKAADRFLAWMVERGHRADRALERTPLAGLLGFFWLARAVRRPGPPPG